MVNKVMRGVFGKINNPYHMYKEMTEEEFNKSTKKLSELGELLRDDLFFQHNDSYQIVKNLTIPRMEMRMPYTEVLESIQRSTVGSMQIFLNISGNEKFSSINLGETDILNGTEWNMSRLYGMLDQITYATMAITSPFILSQLLFYVSRESTFVYIRDSIIKPNLNALVAEAYKTVQLEATTQGKNDTKVEVVGKVREFIHAILISANYDVINNTREFLIKNRDKFYNDIYGEISRSQYFIPEFIYKLVLFKNNEELVDAQDEYDKFIKIWSTTLTVESGLNSLRHYSSAGYDYYDKVKYTILERNRFHGLVDTQLVDGVTIEEMAMIIRCLGHNLTSEDKELLPKTKVAKNIYKIIESTAGLRTTWTIDNTSLTATDADTKKVRKFDYRNPNFEMDIDRDYSILPIPIKKQLIANPDVNALQDCFLFSNGYVCDLNDAIRIDSINRQHSNTSKLDRVSLRNRTITQWLTQNSASNPNLVKRFTDLINRSGDMAYKEISPGIQLLGSHPIIKSKMEDLVETLCEIEGIYRMLISKAGNKINTTKEVSPPKIIKSSDLPSIEELKRRTMFVK